MKRIAYLLLRTLGIGRPAPTSRFGRLARKDEKVVGFVGLAYIALQAYPQPLFAHAITENGITCHSRRPLSGQISDRLSQARALVDRSELAVPNRTARVFDADGGQEFGLNAVPLLFAPADGRLSHRGSPFVLRADPGVGG
jgi:hypothetical protein